jgi:hypothetical protein
LINELFFQKEVKNTRKLSKNRIFVCHLEVGGRCQPA